MWFKRTNLLVGVLDLQALLSRIVPELGEPLEEQRVRTGGQGAFPTQPDRLRGCWHPFGPATRETTQEAGNNCKRLLI